jgi:hypothetical protein
MNDKSKIMAYIHCSHCVREGRSEDVNVGLISETTLRVWCNTHQLPVYDFDLREAIPVKCDMCGDEVKPGHHH